MCAWGCEIVKSDSCGSTLLPLHSKPKEHKNASRLKRIVLVEWYEERIWKFCKMMLHMSEIQGTLSEINIVFVTFIDSWMEVGSHR